MWSGGFPDTQTIDQVTLVPHDLPARRCADLLRAGSYLATPVFETMEIHPVPVRWLGLHRLARRTFDWLWSHGWFARLLTLALRFLEASLNGRLDSVREVQTRAARRKLERTRRRQRADDGRRTRRETADLDLDRMLEQLERLEEQRVVKRVLGC